MRCAHSRWLLIQEESGVCDILLEITLSYTLYLGQPIHLLELVRVDRLYCPFILFREDNRGIPGHVMKGNNESIRQETIHSETNTSGGRWAAGSWGEVCAVEEWQAVCSWKAFESKETGERGGFKHSFRGGNCFCSEN